MLNKLKTDRNTNKGFTIIEVLIVLAIAGLILLVVFLAVPALQRNQRNSGYKSEANRILASAQEVSANNGGAVLGVSSCTATGSTACTTVPVVNDAQRVFQASNSKNVDTLKIELFGTTNAGPSLSSVTLVTGAKCPSALLSVTATGTGTTATSSVALTLGTTRQTVLVYAVEDNAGKVIGQCQES